MPITIQVTCSCGWDRIGGTNEQDALNFDEILRKAQTHANREDHELKIKGTIKPEGK